MIQNALSCLRTASSNLTDSYSLALFSYTFTLAGDQHASDLFKALQSKAIKEGHYISLVAIQVAFKSLFPELVSVLINSPFPCCLKPLSKRGQVHNQSYENEFNLHVNNISL